MRLIDADAWKEMIPNTSVDMFENCRNCSLLSEEQVNELIDMTPTVNSMIPCSERLPEKPYGCLVTVESSRFDGGEFVECESILPYFVGYDGNDWYDGDGERCQYEVIAWMPLPEPYRKEKQ